MRRSFYRPFRAHRDAVSKPPSWFWLYACLTLYSAMVLYSVLLTVVRLSSGHWALALLHAGVGALNVFFFYDHRRMFRQRARLYVRLVWMLYRRDYYRLMRDSVDRDLQDLRGAP